MKIVSIGLVFENCESCTIPAEFISYLHVGGISESITLSGRQSIVRNSLSVNNVNICFNDAFNTYKGETQGHTLITERVRSYMDICWIYLNYEDASSKHLGVVWKGSGDNNEAQTCTEEDGLLMLEIKS